MTDLSKRRRLEAVISGEQSDRTPIALWRHWPGDDQDASALATTTIKWQRDYDWDFVKHSPSSSFTVSGFGLVDQWRGNSEGSRDYTFRPIETADDWAIIEPLDPSKGALAVQLQSLHELRQGLGPGTPIIASVFSPLTQASYLASNPIMLSHLRSQPDRLHSALKSLTETTLRYVEMAKEAAIDGIYYVVQHNRYDLLSVEEFNSFGKFYDAQVLATVQDLWLNTLHVHEINIMFDEVADYPVQIINWHDRDTAPTIGEGLTVFPGAASGGISQDTLHRESPDPALVEAADAVGQAKGRLVLGTGCVSLATTPLRNIRALRAFVEN
ncbi:MAG: uroporphyrinogen decarboxylase family protein [Acidimicrobiales bacterium]